MHCSGRSYANGGLRVASSRSMMPGSSRRDDPKGQRVVSRRICDAYGEGRKVFRWRRDASGGSCVASGRVPDAAGGIASVSTWNCDAASEIAVACAGLRPRFASEVLADPRKLEIRRRRRVLAFERHAEMVVELEGTELLQEQRQLGILVGAATQLDRETDARDSAGPGRPSCRATALRSAATLASRTEDERSETEARAAGVVACSEVVRRAPRLPGPGAFRAR